MNVDVGIFAEALTQFAFNVGSMAVRLIERNFARHPQVHLYGNGGADAAGAKIVHAAHLRLALCNLRYLFFLGSGQTLLQQLAHGATHKMQGSANDKHAHHNGSQGIEHRPTLS